MRVAVVINSKAGSVDEALVESRVREALFRCDLRFLVPQSLEETEAFAAEEIGRADYFMICGGDGTINVTLQSLLRQSKGAALPPICIVRSGTANDLALQIGVSRKIEKAARSILEGEVKHIDLIELEADTGQKTFMITNGGIGIPAVAADIANRLRGTLRQFATCPRSATAFQFLAHQSYNLVKKMGSAVYTTMAVEALRQWKDDDWELEISIPDRESFVTKASCVLVNNQPVLGRSMVTAPYTSNRDGLVNLLVVEANTLKAQVQTVVSFRRGKADKLPISRSFELSTFRLKSRDGHRPLTFFGDGEILLKDVREITVRCRHQGLPLVMPS